MIVNSLPLKVDWRFFLSKSFECEALRLFNALDKNGQDKVKTVKIREYIRRKRLNTSLKASDYLSV